MEVTVTVVMVVAMVMVDVRLNSWVDGKRSTVLLFLPFLCLNSVPVP
jgi:hypothetical protein